MDTIPENSESATDNPQIALRCSMEFDARYASAVHSGTIIDSNNIARHFVAKYKKSSEGLAFTILIRQQFLKGDENK